MRSFINNWYQGTIFYALPGFSTCTKILGIKQNPASVKKSIQILISCLVCKNTEGLISARLSL